MKIITDLSKFKKQDFPNLVLALGNFDGVHAGHRKIFAIVRARAKAIRGTSAVFTFKEHPDEVLRGRKESLLLTSLEHKLHLLQGAGLDLCFLIEFTREFASTAPEDFVRNVFLDTLGAREICLGYNARFGRERRGDARLMKRLSERWGFKFFKTPRVIIAGRPVSSTRVRLLVRAGKLKEVSRLLARPYAFLGKVVGGSGRGTKLGFPTANLDPNREVLPPVGVYAASVRILESRFETEKSGVMAFSNRAHSARLKALLNYGIRPTFGGAKDPVPEVHLLDYRGSLKGKTVEVRILGRLRDEKKFQDAEGLKKQIEIDIRASKRYFKAVV